MPKLTFQPSLMLVVALAALLTLAAAPPASAVVFTAASLLTDEQKEGLIPNALEQYNKAEHFIDRGNYKAALSYLENAFNEQDDHAEMNFLLAALAIYRGRQTFGKDSVDSFDLAEKALKANLKIKKLSFNNRQRTEKKIESVQDERDSVAERDNKRTAIGREFIREQLTYRGVDPDAKKKEDEEKEKAQSGAGAAAASSTSTSPFVAPGGSPFTAPAAAPPAAASPLDSRGK